MAQTTGELKLLISSVYPTALPINNLLFHVL